MNFIECIHRDDTNQERDIKVGTLMDDRSEIHNRAIARIKSASQAQGLAEPRIREKGDFVDVEFYRQTPDTAEKTPDSAGYNQIRPDHLTPQERDVIQHDRITAVEIATLLTVKGRRARTVLKDMIDKGQLEKRGSARQTVYVKADV